MKNYLYDGYLKTFIYRDVGKMLNISFDDFLNRPRYEIERILQITNEINEKKIKSTEDSMKELEKVTQKPLE